MGRPYTRRVGRPAPERRGGLTVRTEEYTARIDLPAAFEAQVRSALVDLVVDDPGPEAAVPVVRVTTERGEPVVSVDGVRWAPGPDQSLCDQLIYVLMRASLDDAPQRLHLHGGYVARHGHGILVGGFPRTGKSTLVVRLVESGFDYFTDERVGLGADLDLVPLHKPVSVTQGSFLRLARVDPRVTGRGSATDRLWHVPATAIRPGSLGTIARPTDVVFLERAAVAGAEVTEIAPAQMARLLLSDALDARRAGAEGLERAARFCASVRCWRLVCDDIEAAVAPIERLATLGPRAGARQVEPLAPAAIPGATPTALTRAPGVTGVVIDGLVLLRTDAGEIVELPETLGVWFRLFDGTLAFDALVAEVAEANDLPLDVVAPIAREAKATLRARGLVR